MWCDAEGWWDGANDFKDAGKHTLTVANRLPGWHNSQMPIFLERMILPALAAILVVFGVTNPLDLGWQVRLALSAIVLATGYGLAWSLHRHNRNMAAHRHLVPPLPPITLPDGRVLIRESPSRIMRLCGKLMRVEIDRVTAPYVGKWIKVAGKIEDIDGAHGRTMVTMRLPGGQRWRAKFDSPEWIDKLNVQPKGSPVKVFGKIDTVYPDRLYLTDCELDEQKG